jgi:hypothetical protein
MVSSAFLYGAAKAVYNFLEKKGMIDRRQMKRHQKRFKRVKPKGPLFIQGALL